MAVYVRIPSGRRFERTYEELKPVDLCVDRVYQTGFERTYEELKPTIFSCTAAGTSTF